MTGLLGGAIASGVRLLTSTDDAGESEAGPRVSIGYFMNDARLSGTDDAGRILYRARAAKASGVRLSSRVSSPQLPLAHSSSKNSRTFHVAIRTVSWTPASWRSGASTPASVPKSAPGVPPSGGRPALQPASAAASTTASIFPAPLNAVCAR